MSTVVLITDFGVDDPYVAELKLALQNHGSTELRLVDGTHAVPAGSVATGRWFVNRLWPQVPPGGVVLAVVDPGVGTARPAIAVRVGDRWFVGPGNGLACDLAGTGVAEVWRLETYSPPPGLAASTTFHGRDLFAPAAAHLAAAGAPDDLGSRGDVGDLGEGPPVEAEAIVWIDRYGNLITGIVPGDAPPGEVRVAGRRVRGPVATFAVGRPGELIWYWGSGGTMEIAVNGGSAARDLLAEVGLAIDLARL